MKMRSNFAFRSLSQLDVMRKIHTCIDLCIRMQPSRDVISCRMEKPAEVNSAASLAQCLHQCRPAHSDIRTDIRKPRATNPPVRAFSEGELVMAGLGLAWLGHPRLGSTMDVDARENGVRADFVGGVPRPAHDGALTE
jgi:hypothetical protein